MLTFRGLFISAAMMFFILSMSCEPDRRSRWRSAADVGIGDSGGVHSDAKMSDVCVDDQCTSTHEDAYHGVDADCDAQECESIEDPCNDGVRNEDETDIDCGGPLCAPCPNDAACLTGGDCMSEVCTNNACVPGDEAPHWTLTVESDGVGTGTVTSAPAGISCGTACDATFVHGTQVTLTATPTGDAIFFGWSGPCTGSGPCILSMTQSQSVTATFRVMVPLSVEVSGPGNVTSNPEGIDCGATCSAGFVHDTEVELIPSPLNRFVEWSGACSRSEPCSVEMAGTRSVTARFGELFGWGRNGYGEVGDGRYVDGHVPQAVVGDQEWKAVSAGRDNTCAIMEDSTLYCWGRNQFGELGDGSTNDSPTPRVVGSFLWKQVSAGNTHTCAIRYDASNSQNNDRLYCWGAGHLGKLGDGSNMNQASPLVIGSNKWKEVSNGNAHTCAIRADNHRLYCWGHGWYGALGDGSDQNQSEPVPAGTFTWKQVSSGSNHTCAIRADNDRLYCWGISGPRLGFLNSSNVRSPTVVGTHTWKQVAAGNGHTCGIRADNDRAYCWGANESGELGDGSYDESYTPRAVDSTHGWKQLTAGLLFSCGITIDDDLYCWGINANFQLGNTNSNTALRPTPVYGARKWRQVSATHTHAVGLVTR